MNKFAKKMALMMPPIKRRYVMLENLRDENETLKESLEVKSQELSNCLSQIDDINSQFGRAVYTRDKLDDLYEEVVEQYWDKGSSRRFWYCKWPFSRVQLNVNGDVFTCCPDYLKEGRSLYSIGNIFTSSFDEVWNSDKAKKLRYSVSQGNFEYCTKKCPAFTNPTSFTHIMTPRCENTVNYETWEDCSLNSTPEHIMLTLDSTCNLYCLTCRNTIHSNSDTENEKFTNVLNDFVRPALQNCKMLQLDGSGEFLLSKAYEQFLPTLTKNEFPSLALNFFTNGLLFTPERWDKFSNLKDFDITVGISIDAASKDVYEKLRRGGKWETLCNNMRFISSLKATDEINRIILRFVVQKENFHQLNEFVSLGESWNADRICFQRLINYGLHPDEYSAQDVFSINNSLRDEAIQKMKSLIHDYPVGGCGKIEIVQEGCLG